MDLNGLTNSIYMSQQQLTNKSPSFSVNSLKGRLRPNQIQNRINQYLSNTEQTDQIQGVDAKIDCDWDKLEEAAKVIANVQHAFEMSDTENNEYNDEDYAHLNHRSQYQVNPLNSNIINNARTSGVNNRNGVYGKIPLSANNSSSNTPVNSLIMPTAQSVQSLSKQNMGVPHTDAQTIALLLQKQLEDIDNEIR